MRATIGVFGGLRAFHDECAEQVRGRLGAKAYEAAYQYGVRLPDAEALQLALEKPARTPDPSVAPSAPATPLTRREREIADLVAEGLSNREIATRLVIAQRTAEGHVEHILSKLGFTSRAQVAAWIAEQRGQQAGVPPPDP